MPAEWITAPTNPEAWRERITARAVVDDESGCWIWQRSAGSTGYGRFRFVDPETGRYRWTNAHRAAYLAWRGSIGEDLSIDHLCRNRMCVNPEHMEPVTIGENVRRAVRKPKVRPREVPWFLRPEAAHLTTAEVLATIAAS